MVKDYAKSNKAKPAKKKRGPWLIIAAVMLAMLVPLGLFYGKYQKAIHNKGVVNPNIKKIAEKKPATNKAKKSQAKNTSVQFNFYSLLPKAPSQLTTHSPTPQIPMQAKADSQFFVLQVAALSNLKDARRLQKQLKSLGFTTFTQEYKTNSNLWYRVMIGPFNSLQSAKSSQQRLANDQLESILLRLNPKTT